MLDDPEILRTAAQAIAFIALEVPRADIRNVMAPGLAELRAALAAQGVAATGRRSLVPISARCGTT